MSDLLQFLLSQQNEFRRARLPSLFSDFTAQRHTNPDGYIANVNTWKDVLCRAALAGFIPGSDGATRRLSLETGPQLLQNLESKEWGRPLALDAVFEAASKLLPHVQNASSPTDRIFSTHMFNRQATAALHLESELSGKDLNVLLKYLARDRQVLAYDDQTVKVLGPNQTMSPISKEDRSIASLRSLIEDIKEQIAGLEARVAFLSQRSRDAVASKNRTSALATLRSKKSADLVLSQRYDTLFQLEQVFERIKQASDQITMVQVIKDSAGVLRGLNARAGSVTSVEDALEGLKDEMSNAEEIGLAITEAGQNTISVDDEELDAELNDMLCQHQSQEEAKAAEYTKRRLDSIIGSGQIGDNTANQSNLRQDQETIASKTASSASLALETSALERLSLDGESNANSDTKKQVDENSGVMLKI
ncbi:MAG: hypothetical protein Q9174_000716 [Haloplaca sp. 1 TL-2023]